MRPDYNKLFVRLYALMASLGIGLGTAITVGHERRFSSPSFRAPRALVESWAPVDAHWVWGGIFLAYGLWLVFALGRRIALHALRAGIVVYLFLALSFLGSVAIDPRASMTGIVVYTTVAAVHAYLSDHLHARGWEGC